MRKMSKNEYKAPHVVVVGGSNLDCQGKSGADFRPGDSNPGVICDAAGGVGRNIAEACARLGLRVSLVTALGDDVGGGIVRESCARAGVELAPVSAGGKPTGRYLCLLDSDGSLIGAVADMRATDAIAPDALLEYRELLDAADCIVVDANLPRESIRFLAEGYGRGSGGEKSGRPFLFLDPVSETKAARAVGLTGRFDCIKPNRGELAILLGLDPEKEVISADEVPALAEKLRSADGGPGALYISLGAEGMYCDDEGLRAMVALPQTRPGSVAVNRSGAGDVSCAALVWAILGGKPVHERAQFALSAALMAASSIDPVPADLSGESLERRRSELFGPAAPKE